MDRTGLRVGPFEVVSPVRVPETGSWWLARRVAGASREPMQVHLLVLPPDATADQRADLTRRYEVRRTLTDPRVPSTIGLYEQTGAIAFAAPATTPLSGALHGRRANLLPLSPATLLDVLLELTETMAQAHGQGVVHGHLHPGNVALDATGGVWVHGFGERTEPPARYIPPERARSESPSALTDVWGVGAVGLALVTGHPPWPSSQTAAAARKGSVDEAIAPVTRQWPALARLLARAMSPATHERFPSVLALRQELLALARRAGGASDRRAIAQWLAMPCPEEDDADLPTSQPRTPVPHQDGPVLPAEVQIEITDPEAGPALSTGPLPVPLPSGPTLSWGSLERSGLDAIDHANTPPPAPQVDDDEPIPPLPPIPGARQARIVASIAIASLVVGMIAWTFARWT